MKRSDIWLWICLAITTIGLLLAQVTAHKTHHLQWQVMKDLVEIGQEVVEVEKDLHDRLQYLEGVILSPEADH